MPPNDTAVPAGAGAADGGVAASRVVPRLRRTPATWAIGTAVLGRPAYIDTGSAAELPVDRTVNAFQDNTFRVLDAAMAAGIDWVDTARSYGRAEEFVGQWWRARAAADPEWPTKAPTVSSKWGYAYVGDWDRDAAVHEVKDHSVEQFDRQLALTREALPRMHLYQVHSLTPDSPLFDDGPLLDALARLRDGGVAVGFTSSGPRQAETILRALDIERDGAPLFSAVQATWNLLETSAAAALTVASRRELTVIVKEALANGRLATGPTSALRTVAARHDVGVDAVALAAAARQPWANRVLLGSAGVRQLHANLRADGVVLDADELALLTASPQDPVDYWSYRSTLPWQ